MLNEILARRTLYQAFERIRDNGGCQGADGISVGDFADRLEQELDNLQDRLIRRIYHPYPLLRFEIPKSESKVRALCVPAVRDRVLQTAVYLVTRPLFEAEFEACSYAYREGRSVRDAVRRIDELRRQGFHWVVDADIAHDEAVSISAPPPGDKSPGYVAAPPKGGFKQRCYGACSEGTILRA
jgi:retron-type reverse transcriptase